MSEAPWLTIVGLGESGPAGLPPASQAVIDRAEVIMGPQRHIDLLPETAGERITWPVPFADGLPILRSLAGRPVVVLASGDPFWFGAGSSISRHFAPTDWIALPGPSTFSLAAAKLGWSLETTHCRGLHARPLTQLRPDLAPEARFFVLLRDGAAVHDLARYLTEQGFGQSQMTVLEHLGGPKERHSTGEAHSLAGDFSHPVCVAMTVLGEGAVLARASGLPDQTFASDGQITKRPVRAITLSSLAPRPGEHLWDIGAGSGSISMEWLLAHPTTRATAVEARADRAKNITANADFFGVADRLTLVHNAAPAALDHLPKPDAIFVGGGLSAAVLHHVKRYTGARLVVNAVTLEGEALLAQWHDDLGGDLMRIALSQAAPLGPKRGWRAAYPVVQWSVIL